jgi:hypothetical protein
MQTKATDDLLPLDQGDAPPLLGSSQGGFLAGRATSDYDEIVFEMLVLHGISFVAVFVPCLLVCRGVQPHAMRVSLTSKNGLFTRKTSKTHAREKV